MGIWGMSEIKENKTYRIIIQKTSFYTGFYYVIENDKLIKAELQEDIQLSGIFNDLVILQLKSDWETGGKKWKQGSVLSIPYSTI
jgi:prolyl oligopeptidase